jgi:hypothetical protein
LQYTTTWRYDSHTNKAIEKIREISMNNQKQLRISNHWHFEPSINYYISSKKLNIKKTNRNGIDKNTDFILCYSNMEIPEGFSLLEAYNDIQVNLYINNRLK